MIIRQNSNYTMWGPGIRPRTANDDSKYVIHGINNSYGFNDFEQADKKYCEFTGESSLQSLLIKQI